MKRLKKITCRVWYVSLMTCLSCSVMDSPEKQDYYIAISNGHATIEANMEKITYGYTLKNKGVTKASKLQILIRYTFSNEAAFGPQDETHVHDEELLVNETVQITNDLFVRDIEFQERFSLEDLMIIRIYAIRFFNASQSADYLWENTYNNIEGEVYNKKNATASLP